jgi:hypothetical protein
VPGHWGDLTRHRWGRLTVLHRHLAMRPPEAYTPQVPRPRRGRNSDLKPMR